jgi:hypothetical protein
MKPATTTSSASQFSHRLEFESRPPTVALQMLR